jgi:predicted Abi (CAAX) family protease
VSSLLDYLRANLLAGGRVSPARAWPWWLGLTLVYAALAYAIGRSSGLLDHQPLTGPARIYLPLTLFVFPALLEEAFFRGVLIPNATRAHGWQAVAGATLLSTVAFVLWHPLNALSINPGARELFLDPAFLLIVSLLGVTCSLAYILSRSLWAPVLIHWLTVLVWVLWLGGRNLLLET